MTNAMRKILLLCTGICLALALTSCGKQAPSGGSSTGVQFGTDGVSPPDSGAVWEETEDTGRQTEALPYISPIDFEELQKGNPDIYAWIEIDGAGVSYPVVQRPEDNAFYLDHNDAGQSDIYGAIFTEDYNSRDFEDAVTVIYGHTAKNGRMFGTLQRNYSDRAFFDSHRTIRIYLPDREMAYTIFAAVPYSNIHILYYYDFSYAYVYDAFFEDVMSVRTLDANKDVEAAPQYGDHVIILSTCLDGNSEMRYLVMAVRNETDEE